MTHHTDAAVKALAELCAIPSPTGYTRRISEHLMERLAPLSPAMTRKGTVIACLGGQGQPLTLAAHVDTLGAMVRAIKSNGRLRPTTLGSFNWQTADGENCTVFTREGAAYSGVILHNTPSIHVSGADVKREEGNMEILLDDKADSADEVRALGIRVGDIIAADPRTVIAPSGIIKSRFLDDKASAGILLALADWAQQERAKLTRKVYVMFTTYEEVGHGGSSGVPEDTAEMISVDMGAVGDDLGADERKVSICAKDSGGPYDYDVTTALIHTAERLKLNFAIDVYPRYGSDVEATLSAGYDIRHGLIGPGVYASHNYERTHREGLEQTLKLLAGMIGLL